MEEIRLDMDGEDVSRKAWMDAIRELESTAAKPPAVQRPAPPRQPVPPAPAADKDSPQALARKALNEVNLARRTLDEFLRAHPYLVAPNIHRLWEDNLRESSLLLERELERRPG